MSDLEMSEMREPMYSDMVAAVSRGWCLCGEYVMLFGRGAGVGCAPKAGVKLRVSDRRNQSFTCDRPATHIPLTVTTRHRVRHMVKQRRTRQHGLGSTAD